MMNMRKKKLYEAADDGRTISDMSEIARRTPLGYVQDPMPHCEPPETKGQGTGDPRERAPLSKEDRRAVFFGTMKATLLVGAAYLCGFAILIALICVIFI